MLPVIASLLNRPKQFGYPQEKQMQWLFKGAIFNSDCFDLTVDWMHPSGATLEHVGPLWYQVLILTQGTMGFHFSGNLGGWTRQLEYLVAII